MRRLRIVSGFGFIWILVCFGPRGLFRYSDFGFMSPGYWHRKFVEVGLFTFRILYEEHSPQRRRVAEIGEFFNQESFSASSAPPVQFPILFSQES